MKVNTIADKLAWPDNQDYDKKIKRIDMQKRKKVEKEINLFSSQIYMSWSQGLYDFTNINIDIF